MKARLLALNDEVSTYRDLIKNGATPELQQQYRTRISKLKRAACRIIEQQCAVSGGDTADSGTHPCAVEPVPCDSRATVTE